jgi:hypothetical protein
MGWLKVAVAAVPVTTLLLVFVLVGTVVALLLGLDEITVGSVAAPTSVPGATVTPGATAAKALPIPPPASNAANSNAINIGGLYELSNPVIYFPSFMSPQGTGGWPIRCLDRWGSHPHIETKPREKLFYIDHLRQLSRQSHDVYVFKLHHYPGLLRWEAFAFEHGCYIVPSKC